MKNQIKVVDYVNANGETLSVFGNIQDEYSGERKIAYIPGFGENKGCLMMLASGLLPGFLKTHGFNKPPIPDQLELNIDQSSVPISLFQPTWY